MNINIVDCTLRDGGHLNEWGFSDDCIVDSYESALLNSVPYFELGYIMQESQRSPAYILELLNSHAKLNGNLSFMAMINARNFNSQKYKDFNRQGSAIKDIRLACYPNEIEMALEICEEIYPHQNIFLNLMNASELDKQHLKTLEKWNNKHILTCLYFADSYGSMINTDIKKYTNILLSLGYINIGFHGHNNLQMALMNTVEAINCGCTYVDASIFGMGRGGGNLPIEILLSYLAKEYEYKFCVKEYLKVINKHYKQLNNIYNWNYSYENLLGGLFNIHPSELENISNYSGKELDELIDRTKKKG